MLRQVIGSAKTLRGMWSLAAQCLLPVQAFFFARGHACSHQSKPAPDRCACPPQSIARPSGRAGHSMALLRVQGGKHALVVHGGRTKDSRLCKDTWLLELAS